MAKNISTRIGLKIDTLAKWNESAIGLLPAELAIATVAAGEGSGLSEPVIMIKVGEDGVKTFKDLDWAVHAKASDVYSWAKQSEADFVAGFFGLTNADGQTLEQILDLKFATNAELAADVQTLRGELTAALANYYTKTEIDSLIGDLDVGAMEGRIDAVETAVNTTLPGEIGSVDAKFANYTTTTAQQAIDAEQDRRLTAIEGDYLKAADIANFETKEKVQKVADDLAAYVESNDAAVADRYTKAEADGKFALKGADAYDDTEVRGLISDNADAIAAEKERAEGIEGGLRTDVDAVTARVEAFLTGTGTEAALDSLQELIEYINTHDDVDIAGILSSIQGLENKLAGIDTTVVAYVTAAIEALKIGDYAKAADLTALAARVKVLEDNEAGYATTDQVATAKQEAIDAAATSAAGLYQPKGDYATAEQGTKADNAAAAIATYGDIVTHNAAEFASSAENGAKAAAEAAQATADAALPKATAEADYVKKVDAPGYTDILTKTEAGTTYRKVADKITSDDLSDEVWVFNCGTASTII